MPHELLYSVYIIYFRKSTSFYLHSLTYNKKKYIILLAKLGGIYGLVL